jgi:hypothetical protein
MGMGSSSGGRRGVLLVGDAAGLVNPLQGEGIAQAIESASAAAEAICSAANDPSVRYRTYLAQRHAPYQHATAFVHQQALHHQRSAYIALNALSHLPFRDPITQAWGIYWNDLSDAAGPIPGARLARTIGHGIELIQRASSISDRVRRPLHIPTAPSR